MESARYNHFDAIWITSFNSHQLTLHQQHNTQHTTHDTQKNPPSAGITGFRKTKSLSFHTLMPKLIIVYFRQFRLVSDWKWPKQPEFEASFCIPAQHCKFIVSYRDRKWGYFSFFLARGIVSRSVASGASQCLSGFLKIACLTLQTYLLVCRSTNDTEPNLLDM